jgi:hypothetical protein
LLSNIYAAYVSGYLHKIEQITEYDWLTKETLETLVGILSSTIGPQTDATEFEHTLDEEHYYFHDKDIHIAGRADMVDTKALWEFKCVDSLKGEHSIQLALYAWLWQETEYATKGSRRFLLHNIRTGEVLELKGVANLKYIMDMILDNYFRTSITLTNEEFIHACRSDVKTYTAPTTNTIRCMFVDDD